MNRSLTFVSFFRLKRSTDGHSLFLLFWTGSKFSLEPADPLCVPKTSAPIGAFPNLDSRRLEAPEFLRGMQFLSQRNRTQGRSRPGPSTRRCPTLTRTHARTTTAQTPHTVTYTHTPAVRLTDQSGKHSQGHIENILILIKFKKKKSIETLVD